MHEVEQPDQGLDRRQYQQGEKKMLGFGMLVGNEDLDPDDGEEPCPDAHVRSHTRVVIDAPDAIVRSSRLSGSARVHQIHQRKYEHPDDVNEVPVEAGGLDVVRVQASAIVAPRDHGQRHDPRSDMQQVKARDAEERGAEVHRSARRIMEESPAISEHVEPFTKMQRRKNNAEKHRKSDPLDRFVLIASLCGTHCNQHGEAAREQHERHHQSVGDAGPEVERPRPVWAADAQKAVGDKGHGKRDRVRGYEEPHRQLFRLHSVGRFFHQGAVPRSHGQLGIAHNASRSP